MGPFEDNIVKESWEEHEDYLSFERGRYDCSGDNWLDDDYELESEDSDEEDW